MHPLRSQAVLVDSLSTVVYETRCLERVISRQLVPLQLPADLAEAPAEEFERVQGVVAEADDKDYWFHASRDGNREKHYRCGASGPIGELICSAAFSILLSLFHVQVLRQQKRQMSAVGVDVMYLCCSWLLKTGAAGVTVPCYSH